MQCSNEYVRNTCEIVGTSPSIVIMVTYIYIYTDILLDKIATRARKIVNGVFDQDTKQGTLHVIMKRHLSPVLTVS